MKKIAEIAVVLVLALLIGGRVAADDETCLECHADPELVRETEYRAGTSVFVDPAHLERSVHAGIECLECHIDASDDHPERLEAAACADCHDDAVEAYAGSLHGQAQQAGNADAPNCADCHGAHEILAATDPASLAHPKKVPQTCATCHADPTFIARQTVTLASSFKGYERSVHYAALQSDDNGATCTDCHQYHALYKSSDPRSAIHDFNVPRTCGQCHADIQDTYEQSIHGRALAHGNTDSPDCVDCHGEHEIRDSADPASRVYPAHISQTTCVWCHESELIVSRYDLPGQRLSTYADSYHGLADRTGSTTVANCASCHGIHSIRPSDDPTSSIHPDNLPTTCGQCHPGASRNVARGPVHTAPGTEGGEHAAVYYIRHIYILLILVVIGAMAAHNGGDFLKKFSLPRLPHGRDHLRFTVNERLQHGIMALSFITLAYSGFALKFPQEWWVAPLVWVDAAEEGRRLIHRIAAVIMVTICLYHLVYIALSRRGRQQLRAMLPRGRDLRDLGQMLLFYANRRDQGPAFGRFSYIEKIEYWALIWGSVIMTLTGFALWFDNLSLRFLPKWALDVATTIHYYEAWLATLAIVFWHFYWVIFNPQVYPMSLVWLTGRMSTEAMEHEHPRELQGDEEKD